MSKQQEQQALSDIQMDNAVLDLLKKQRGLTLSAILSQIRKATSPAVQSSLKRLIDRKAVTRSKLDGIVRYYRAGYMLDDAYEWGKQLKKDRLHVHVRNHRLTERPYVVPVMEREPLKMAFSAPARPGAMDFAACPSGGPR